MQSNQAEKPKKTSVDKSQAAKILRSVPFEQGFHFAADLGKFTGETAINLFSFYEELRTIEPKSVKFHLQRRDFQKWVETTLEDAELASRIDKTPSGLNDEELKEEILRIVQMRLMELQSVALLTEPQSVSEAASKQTSPELGMNAEEPKKFTVEDLKQNNGQSGKPAYFAFEGKVYDVSESSLWIGGEHMAAHDSGKDLTGALKSAPHGEEVFSKVKKVGVLA